MNRLYYMNFELLAGFLALSTFWFFYRYLLSKLLANSFLFPRKWKSIMLSWLVFAIIWGIGVLLLNYIGKISEWFLPLVLLVFGMLVLSIDFILSPLLNHYETKHSKAEAESIEALKKELNLQDIKLIIQDSKKINAFAMGAVPFSRLIIIGKKLFTQFNREQQKALILHEKAHLIKHHVLLLYLLHAILFVCSFYFVIYFNATDIRGTWKAPVFLGGGSGLMYYYIPRLFMKRYEYKADAYAAGVIGSDAYIDMLNRLDEITGGKLQRNSASHPNLKQRIANVKKKDKR